MKIVVGIVIVILSLFVIKNFLFSIYNFWHKEELVMQVQKELETEKRKYEQLKKELAKVNAAAYVEVTARNKLFFVRPGEQEVIIPSSLLRASGSGRMQPQDNRPNWKKWWELFF